MPKYRNIRRKKRQFLGNQHRQPSSFSNTANLVNIQDDVNTSLTPVNNPAPVNNPVTVNNPAPVKNPVLVNNPDIQNQDSVDVNNASFTSTASFRKLSDNAINLSETILISPQKVRQERKKRKFTISGNRFVDIEILASLITETLACPVCFTNSTMTMRQTLHYGSAQKYEIECCCGFSHSVWSSKKAAGKGFDINKRLIYAMRSIGVGYSGLKKFCFLMNIPPPLTARNYKKQILSLKNIVKAIAKETMTNATADLRIKKGVTSNTALVDIAVSCDGSWQKRGYSSLNGFVSAISMESGKLVDISPMSRFCKSCSNNKKWKKVDPVKYDILQKNHRCMANYEGSAPAMEVTGVKKMFNRSIQNYATRYTEYIGDGDSKSFVSIQNAYEGVQVVKKECVGHVQKRMGTRLRNLKKNVKGLGGRGRLTDSIIDRFQNYYGIAIRSNVGDIENMKKAIYAVLLHVSSSQKNNWLDQCPNGEKSWCRYKRDKACGTKTYIPGSGLPVQLVLQHLRPIFLDLSKDELLHKCLHGKTQNQNESFNGTVWNRLPKTQYIGLDQFELGVYDAVAHFNIGTKAVLKIYERLGLDPGSFTVDGCSQANRSRLKKAGRKNLIKTKTQRKIVRGMKKNKSDKQAEKEGTTYASGAFD